MENIVYTTATCPYCMMVKRLLAENEIEFEERCVRDRDELDEIKDKYKWRTVPIVILNGKFIGGYNETNRLVSQGKLAETLGRG